MAGSIMATTTPNYGWDVPTSTDYVKDGATAIETLGDDIDASMFTALQGKKSGLVLLNTTSFSAVASQNITSVFSSTYDNYRIVYNLTKSTNTYAYLRLLVGTTPDSGSDNYAIESITASSTTLFSIADNQSAFFVMSTDTQAQVGSMDLLNPFETSETFLISNNFTGGYSTAALTRLLNGKNRTSTSFNGFQLVANSGTITGKVYTYGYNN
jgi:hypothetical protein